MKCVTSGPTLSNKENITNGSLASALIVKAFKKATFIPNNATNGDIIKALFPKIDDNFSNVIDLKLWWNAPYKAESELGCDDCILDDTDACRRGAGRAIDDEPCEGFLVENEPQESEDNNGM